MKIRKAGRDTKFIWGLFFMLCFAVRILWLDRDLPDWGIMNYTPMDEGYYAMQAIQNTRTEDMELVKLLDSGKYPAWNSAVSYALTVFTTITLALFGNNYYGLRMGSMIAAAIVLLLLLWIVRKESETKTQLLIAGGFMLCNFPFFLTSKVVEPTIYRMMLSMVTIFFFWREQKKEEPGYFWLGFWSMLSICWGYVTNVFVLVPCVAMAVAEKLLFQRRTIRVWASGIAGAVTAFGGSELLMYLTQGRTFLQDTLRILGSQIGGQRISGFSGMYDNLRATMSGAVFVYCAALFVAVVVAVIICLIYGWKLRDRMMLYLSFWSLGWGAMQIVTADFPLRKTVVTLPVFVLLIFYAAKAIKTEGAQPKGKKRILINLFVAGTGVIAVWNVSKFLEKLLPNDMSLLQKRGLFVCNLLAVVFLCLYLCLESGKVRRTFGALSLAIVLGSNIYMDWHYVIDQGKTEAAIMQELNELVGHDFVLGNGYSYCLYNEIIPASSTYDHYYGQISDERARQLLLEDKVNYFISYWDDTSHEKWLEDSPYHWEVVKRFEHTYEVSGRQSTDICLFRKAEN